MRKRVGWADLGLSICGGCGDPVPDGQDLCPFCEEAVAWAAFEEACLQGDDKCADVCAFGEIGGDRDDGK